MSEFALFGSVVRGEVRPKSNVDVLITFAPDAWWSFFGFVEMQEVLKVIFGREMHLVEPDSLRNPFRRHEILRGMETVYTA